MFRRFALFTGVLLGIFVPHLAQAATFCIAGQGMTPQCYYDDVKSCIRAAQPPVSYCEVDPDAQLMYLGSQKYCVVQSDRLAQCVYDDRADCNTIAARQDALCIDRSRVADDINPFRFDDRIQN